MKQLTVFFLLYVLTMPLLAQERVRTERHTGTLRTDFPEPGEVTYYYYTHDRQRIMHGIYRYRLRWQNDKRQRINQNISGSMEHGLKAGSWSYNIAVLDYFPDRDGNYYSYDIQLNASYKEGVPHGLWQLNKTEKRRQKAEDHARKTWGDYNYDNSYTLGLKFNMGQLTDTIWLSDKMEGVEVRGSFDKQGFYHGKWITRKEGSILTETYYHGVLTHAVQRNKETEGIEFEEDLAALQRVWSQYRSSEGQPEGLNVEPVMSNALEDQTHVITTMINRHLFDYRFFLYGRIPGDALIRAYPGSNPASLFSGAKKVDFRYRVDGQQARYLSSISSDARRIMEQYRNANAHAYRNGLMDKYEKELDQMEYYAHITAKYNCLMGIIKTYMDLQDGRNDAYRYCNPRYPVQAVLPTDLDKNDLIVYVYREVRKMHNQSRQLMQEITGQ